jgi:hypothetical protein
MKTPVTNRDEAKARARELRAGPRAGGAPISHAEALERVAAELGCTDWNNASARLSNEPDAPLHVGDLGAGRYLKQPFTGRALGVREIAGGARSLVRNAETPAAETVICTCVRRFETHSNSTTSTGASQRMVTSNAAPHMVVEPTGGGIL